MGVEWRSGEERDLKMGEPRWERKLVRLEAYGLTSLMSQR
jgi:hypothetical protein